MTTMPRSKAGWSLWILGYFAVLALIVYGMFRLREKQLANLDTPLARAEWQEWREAAKHESTGAGPVQRRVPKSSEPPLFVLLTEYFHLLLIFSVVFGSLFYFVLVFFARGALMAAKLSGQGEE